MKMPTPFSRLSAASDTGLTAKFRENLYVRTTVTIILLQVILALLVLLTFGEALEAQQKQTIATIFTAGDAVVQALGEEPLPPEELTQMLDTVRTQNLRYTLLGIVLLTACFGYLTARYALRPVRNSLTFQKQFISDIAHEVRTPLAIIKTNTEVALMNPALNNDAREVFESTLQELNRISETINSLLSFNALVQPNRALFSATDLSEVAEAVVERHRELAESRGVSLTFTSRAPHFILGNQTGLDQVVANLVKNAIHYTPQQQGRTVDVTVHATRTAVVLSVADTGIGIARKNLQYIFQPYFRVESSRVRGISGGTSGLGLAIVNEIVKQHKGSITVRSALDRGTTITVSFPALAPKEVVEDEDAVEEVDVRLA